MPKEILLYAQIYSYSAANFINELEANKDNAICVRGNCPGGDMFSTYGMIAKFKEHKGGKEIQVDGIAASAFAYMLCFADKVTCLDVSTFLFHRAACGSLADEKNMCEGDRVILSNVNASIRAGLESKVDAELFKKVTGKSLDDMFSMEDRLDVILNAKQMSKLGLVHVVQPLTAAKKNEIKALSSTWGVAAFAKDPVIEETISTNSLNTKPMTTAEFKAANPTGYAEIQSEAVTQERDRVDTWMLHNTADPAAVAAGIASGKAITGKEAHALMLKAFSGQTLANVKTDNPQDVKTPAPEANTKTEAQMRSDDILATARKNLGIKK